MVPDEGYIKFDLKWIKRQAFNKVDTSEIVRYRNICRRLEFIGIKDGVGYGNISVRHGQTNNFIISGTQTGGLKRLNSRHFTLVNEVDFSKNFVACAGPVKASAESLTHAMFYVLDKRINSVIHIHHERMWRILKNRVPTTGDDIQYGTVAMCKEVERLYEKSALQEMKILVMAGHFEGIIGLGENCADALTVLLRFEVSI